MRDLGLLGMSYGTSSAFESDEAKHIIPKSDTLLINLRTLIRNVHSAYDAEDPLATDITSLFTALVEDVKGIGEALKVIAPRTPLHVEIYYPAYKHLDRKFPKADLWKPTTEKQIALHRLYDQVAEKFLKDYSSLVTRTEVGPPEFKGKGVIITHHAVDLVVNNSWGRLNLLESHEGVVKPFLQWNTKLTGNDNWNIPLNRMTIQIFGDRSTNFKSQSIKIKRLVKDLAEKAGWTSATTPDRCRNSINTYLTGVDRAGLLLYW